MLRKIYEALDAVYCDIEYHDSEMIEFPGRKMRINGYVRIHSKYYAFIYHDAIYVLNDLETCIAHIVKDKQCTMIAILVHILDTWIDA